MATISFNLDDPKEQLVSIRDLLNAQLAPVPEKKAPTVTTEAENAEDEDNSGNDENDGAATPAAAAAPAATAKATSQANDTDAPVDEKGVPFNAEFCGKAAKPFYGSGKKQGQWKKRQGVDEADYDAWYAEMLETAVEADPVVDPDEDDAPVNTAAAFGGGEQQQQAAAPAGIGDAPKDVGEFMGWIAEQQTAGNLDQDKIGLAYTQAGVAVTDLFAGSDEEKAEKIGLVYEQLQAML